MTSLPIDAILEPLRRAVSPGAAVVVEATPGAGKTTRVPAALADAGLRTVVLEPRRLAARLAAQRVAAERGEAVGGFVGHQVRFDAKFGPQTRLRFVTEGVLTRLMLSDPELHDFDAVVLDEIHERHRDGDLALALVDRLRRTTRPDLRLVAMSATLDGEALAAHLDGTLLRSEQRQHPITIHHLERPDRDPLEIQVAKALRRLTREGLAGHVLVFLPGAQEIRRAAEACRPVARDADLELFPLYGALAPKEQDAAVAPSERRKVILATNIAESSLTIPGVAAVIDSGLVKRARHSPWSTVSGLVVEPISRASAVQRAGRAGRERAGRCLRLYTEPELRRMAASDEPEILRSELSEIALACHVVGADPRRLPWWSPPDEAGWDGAERLLTAIGAVHEGTITPRGRRVAQLPLPPRLGRALGEAARRGVVEPATVALAILSEGRGVFRGRRRSASLWSHSEALEEITEARFDRHLADAMEVDLRAARQLDRVRKQLRSAARRLPRADVEAPADVERELARALLTGFVDRVGRRGGGDRGAGGEIALSDGTRARLADEAAFGPEGLCLVLDATRSDPSRPATVRLAAPLTLDDVFDAQADGITDEEELTFARGRVESVARLRYGRLVLEESRGRAAPGPAASAQLVDALLRRGLESFGAVESWLARARFAGRRSEALSAFDEADLRARLQRVAEGMTSFAEIESAGLEHLLAASLEPEQRRLIDELAPARLPLTGGRRLALHYPADAPPWVEGYLQDFFGQEALPPIAGDKVVARLWAPNKRPIQVTDDLAGFWQRLYPELRRQLSRRYPKHHWPDDPTAARAVLLKRQL